MVPLRQVAIRAAMLLITFGMHSTGQMDEELVTDLYILQLQDDLRNSCQETRNQAVLAYQRPLPKCTTTTTTTSATTTTTSTTSTSGSSTTATTQFMYPGMTVEPTLSPSEAPTLAPSVAPTPRPSPAPTEPPVEPTPFPTPDLPTSYPTPPGTPVPTVHRPGPTDEPTPAPPSDAPTPLPTPVPKCLPPQCASTMNDFNQCLGDMAAGQTCKAAIEDVPFQWTWCNNPCIAAGDIEFKCPCLSNRTSVLDTEPALISASVQCKPCAVSAQVMDSDTDPGKFSGTIRWGPNMILGEVDERMIEGYRVYVVDHWGIRLSVDDDTIDGLGEPCTDDCIEVASGGIREACCDAEAYNVTWSLTLPHGYDRFMIVAYHSEWGPLPAGAYVSIYDEGGGCKQRRSIQPAMGGAAAFAAAPRVAAMVAVFAAGVTAIEPEKLFESTCEVRQGEALLIAQESPALCEHTRPTITTTTTTYSFYNGTTTFSWAKPCGCVSFKLFGTLYGSPRDTDADTICTQGESPDCYLDTGKTCASYVHNDLPGSNPCIAEGVIQFKCPLGNTEGGRHPELVSGSIICEPCYVPPRVVDVDIREGMFEGTLTWGPNLIRGSVNDSMLDGYRVYIVDSCGFPLPGRHVYAEVPSLHLELDCCDTLMYSAHVKFMLPEGYDRFMIAGYNSVWGDLPAGGYVPIEDSVFDNDDDVIDSGDCGGAAGSTDVAAASAAALVASPTKATGMIAAIAVLGASCASGQAISTTMTTTCDVMHGPAILATQEAAIYCSTETTSTTSSTSTSSTSTSATTTTSTTSDFVACTCPYLNTSLYGGTNDITGGGACCHVPSGSTCKAFSANYEDHADIKRNKCVKNGPIEFKCPCANLGYNTMPFLISPNILCKPCSVAARVYDRNWQLGQFDGTITFGPNMIDGTVDETMIEGYRIYVVDNNSVPLQVPGGPDYVFCASRGLVQDCCDAGTYEIAWQGALPAGADRFSIVAWNSEWGSQGAFDGALPVGEYVEIWDAPDVPRPAEQISRVTASATAHALCAVGQTMVIACVCATISLSLQGRPGLHND